MQIHRPPPFDPDRTFFLTKCPYATDRLYRVTKKIIAVRIAFESALIADKHDALRTNLLGPQARWGR